MIRFRFLNLTTSDGTQVDLPQTGVVIFVGPNNAGKSQALRDLTGLARDSANYRGVVVKATQFEKVGTFDDAIAWANSNLPMRSVEGVSKTAITGWGEVGPNDFANQWANSPNLNVLSDTMMLLADGRSRLTAGDAPSNIDFTKQFATHPIQRASRDPELEKTFNDLGRRAFGMSVTVDRYAGSVIPLRLGDRPKFEHDDGMPARAYLDALAQLPRLEEQGDGVKSFLGLMTQLIAGSHQVLLVDEPEAFLHPPQARLLGQLLAERSAGQQVFIATHSTDVVQGALEAGGGVTIVRLRRSGAVNRASTLSDQSIKALWADPLLRYSEVLDGLFHDAVVVCESDSDCRYYSAVRDALPGTPAPGERRLELLFTHCGGKQRLHIAIRALRGVDVPVLAIADFDVLRDAAELRRVVEAADGDWAQFEADQRQLDAALTSDRKPLEKIALSQAFSERLNECNDRLTTKDAAELRRLLRIEDGWDRTKRSGTSGVPSGEPFAAAQRLVQALAGLGILVVPVGELERFVPEVGTHGPAWVNSVLAAGLHATPTPEAVTFVESIDWHALQQSSR